MGDNIKFYSITIQQANTILDKVKHLKCYNYIWFKSNNVHAHETLQKDKKNYLVSRCLFAFQQ